MFEFFEFGHVFDAAFYAEEGAAVAGDDFGGFSYGDGVAVFVAPEGVSLAVSSPGEDSVDPAFVGGGGAAVDLVDGFDFGEEFF